MDKFKPLTDEENQEFLDSLDYGHDWSVNPVEPDTSSPAEEHDDEPAELAESLGVMVLAYQNMELIFVVRLVLSIAGILAAIQFLRLRPRSRPSLEGLSWFMLWYFTGSMIFSVVVMHNMAGELDDADSLNSSIYTSIAIIFAFSIPYILSLWQLRGSIISTYFRGITKQRADPAT